MGVNVDQIRVAGRSDVGRQREKNEDRFLVLHVPGGGGLLLAVADGMGGHPAGEEAARLAVEAMEAYAAEAPGVVAAASGDPFPGLSDLLSVRVEAAHAAILAAGAADPARRGLGTTVVAALVHGDRLQVVHSGDSRAYRLRNDTLVQLTRDHVVVESGIRFLAAHLGMPEGNPFERHLHAVAPGDRLLLCSDGLTDMVPPETFGRLLEQAGSPEAAADALVAEANGEGGLDNVTCVVAFL